MLDLQNSAFFSRLAKQDYVFDSNNPNYVPVDAHNVFYFNSMQSYFNDKLQAHGHIFLNEVLNTLGIPTTQIGQLAGWTKDRTGYIAIDITQTRYDGDRPVEYFLRIKHDGIIIDVLGD